MSGYPAKASVIFSVKLVAANIHVPIIFITGHGDIPMSVRAKKAGAVEFLTKPFRDQDLLCALQLALKRDLTRRAQEAGVSILREPFESLTPGEQKVLLPVVSGRPNKQIAAEIGTSETTVNVHCGQVMKTMGAPSMLTLLE